MARDRQQGVPGHRLVAFDRVPEATARGFELADSGKSTLQSILENLRDAAVHFGKRFANPAHVQPELIKLLAELGIDDPLPGRAVSNAMKDAVAAAPGALAAAPEAAGVRVWQITSRKWRPRAGRSPAGRVLGC